MTLIFLKVNFQFQSKSCFLVSLQLQADREHLPVKTDTLKKLQTLINDIILALPDDLQDILLKTGTTWFLLGSFGGENQKASSLTEDSGLPSLEHSSKTLTLQMDCTNSIAHYIIFTVFSTSIPMQLKGFLCVILFEISALKE